MATKGPEHAVKEYTRAQLNSLGPDCWWFMPASNGFGRAGIPDFVGVYKGKGFGIEVKAEKGVVSPHQRRELGKITTARGYAVVVRGVEDAKLVASMLRVWAGESQEGGA